MQEWQKDSKKKYWDRMLPNSPGMLKAKRPAFEPQEREELLQAAPEWKGKKVLDLAGGIGRFTKEFAKEAQSVTFIEWVPEFVAISQRSLSCFTNINYMCADATEVEFLDGSFDLVFASFFFMYLADEEMHALAARIAKWVVPGGHVMLRESCSAVRREPTEEDPMIYRTLWEYDRLLPQFALKKEGSVQAWIDHLANPLICFWVFQKPF